MLCSVAIALLTADPDATEIGPYACEEGNTKCDVMNATVVLFVYGKQHGYKKAPSLEFNLKGARFMNTKRSNVSSARSRTLSPPLGK